MNEYQDLFLLNLSTSRSISQSVLHLLGIKSEIIVNESDIKEITIPKAFAEIDKNSDKDQHGQLHCFLYDLKYNATSKELHPKPLNASDDEYDLEEAKRIEHAEQFIKDAKKYLEEIEDELAKGKESMLRIHPEMTERMGEKYITNVSLDQWSNSKHGHLKKENFEEAIESDPYVIVDKSTKIRNLKITLSLLVEAYISSSASPQKFKIGEKVNASAVAAVIENLGMSILTNDLKKYTGQDKQTIAIVIRDANRIRSKFEQDIGL